MSLQANSTFSSNLAVIGGSGLYSLSSPGDENVSFQDILTPYTEIPVRLYAEQLGDKQVWFIPRHGLEHSIAPHKINYRANMWALNEVGVKKIIAVNAVGGISAKMSPGTIVLPDQILDYTWGREHTYFDGSQAAGAKVFENHIDFTWPYDKSLIALLATTTESLGIASLHSGTYACVQGPRLETGAEIIKLKNDGADIVGMTGMPEAALARELGIDYACIALVVNWGAGLTESVISLDEIKAVLSAGIDDVRRIILGSVDTIV